MTRAQTIFAGALTLAVAMAAGVGLRQWQAPVAVMPQDSGAPPAQPAPAVPQSSPASAAVPAPLTRAPEHSNPPGQSLAPLDAPPTVHLAPAPFLHRVDGDWRRLGRPADAPRETVTIPAAVDIMVLPVSVADYSRCVDEGACLPALDPDQPHDQPVVGVSWIDANAYAEWLSLRTGGSWRLPSDAEWAQGAANLFTDDALEIEDDPANPAVRWLAEYDKESARKRDRDRVIRPVGTLNISDSGMHDIGGAVWEWTSTCLRIVDTDANGAVIRQTPSCGVYIAEGRHRAALTMFVRDPKSGGCSVGLPPDNLGFRLVRETAPSERS